MYSASGCDMLATKSVTSSPSTARIISTPVTSTTSAMPDAIAWYPTLTADAPEAGPFSTDSAATGHRESRSTSALATAT